MNSAYTRCDALSVTPLAFAGSSANANNCFCYSISAFIKQEPVIVIILYMYFGCYDNTGGFEGKLEGE